MPLAIIVLDDNASVLIGEFMNALPATAAWRARTCLVLTTTRNCYCDNALATGSDHCSNRTGFGTTALRVRGVLDIASNVDVTILVDKGRTDTEVRVRAIRLFSHESGKVE